MPVRKRRAETPHPYRTASPRPDVVRRGRSWRIDRFIVAQATIAIVCLTRAAIGVADAHRDLDTAVAAAIALFCAIFVVGHRC